MNASSKLTVINRLKICFNVLTYREKHNHSAQIKGLELFQIGYSAGFLDAMPKIKSEPIFRRDVS